MPAPKSPTGLTATLSSTSIKLTWKDQSSDEDQFRIDRRVELGMWGRVKTVERDKTTKKVPTTWSDANVKKGVHYSYRVKAWSSRGGNSDWSNTVTVKAGATQATPPAPKNLAGVIETSGDRVGKVKLTWTRVTGASYEVSRDGQPDGASGDETHYGGAPAYPSSTYGVRAVIDGVRGDEATITVAGTTQEPAPDPEPTPEPVPVPVPTPVPGDVVVGPDAKQINDVLELTSAMFAADGLTLAIKPGLAFALPASVTGDGLSIVSQASGIPWRLLRKPGVRPMAVFKGARQTIQDVELASDDPIDPETPNVDDLIKTTGIDVGNSINLTIRRAAFVDPLGKGFARVRQLLVSETGDHVKGLRVYDLICRLTRLGQAVYVDDGSDVLLDRFDIYGSHKGISNGIRVHGSDYTFRNGTIEYIAAGVSPSTFRSCFTVQDDTHRVLVENVKFKGGDISAGAVLTTSGWQSESTDDIRFIGCSGERVREITLRKGVTNFVFDSQGQPWDTAASVVVRLNLDNPKIAGKPTGSFANVMAVGKATKFFSSAGTLPTSNCSVNGKPA